MESLNLFLVLLWGGLAAPPAALPTAFVLEDFSAFSVGAVPSDGWSTRGGEAKGSYSIQQDPGSDHFLKAVDSGRSVQLFKEKGWDLKKFPYLRWKWRAVRFPTGADERIGEKNDSTAGVYVVFPRRFFVPDAIKYVWSLQVPVDTRITRSSRFPMIVVRSGTAEQGKWMTETRNVREDFVSLFHRTAPDPVAIGFLTDANDTHSVAEGDYGTLTALASPTGP